MNAIEGARIVLRLPRMDDADRIAALANDATIAHNIPLPHPYGLQDAVSFLEQTFKAQNLERYAITLDDVLIGLIELREIDLDDRSASIGYWMGAPYRGRGYMGEALDLVLDRAFDGLGLRRIGAEALVSNKASRMLLESRGFAMQGTKPNEKFGSGSDDDVVYVLSR